MGNFRDGNRGGFNRGSSRGGSRGRGGFGGGFGGSRDRGERRPLQMYDVTCSKCGKETQVPFKPTGERPVLCRDCFSQNAPSSFRSNSGPSSGAPAGQNYSSQFKEINAKLDKVLAVLAELELVRDDSDMEAEEELEDEEDSHKGHKHPHAVNDDTEEGDELSEGIKQEFQEESDEDSDEDEK